MKKTLLISLSIFVSSLLFLFALTDSKAEKSNDEYLQNIEKIGSDALSEPEFYPKAESVAVDSTEISKLNVVESVAKTLQPEKAMYGFTLKAQSNEDLKGISFVVTKSDDSISDKYILNISEDQVDRDGKPTSKGLSEQYLFSTGIKKIDFYYEGEKNFEISYYDFESKDKGLDSIKKLTATSTDPNTVYKTRFFQQAGLNIITRADMGLPADSTFAPGWTPPYYPVNRIVIHHTATGVDMINPVNTVKAIWRYHAIDNDWGDFGYNYLIDPYGNIYEGRAGINGVRGNHAPPNEGSIGISILGNYTNQQPTQASTNSLIRLMAYLAAVNNIDLTHKTTFDGNNPGGVYGHKDIGQTACPGNTFYPLMDALANNARLVKQTNTEMNNKIASINSLVEGREYYTGANRGDPNLLETNILMNIDNLSPELKTKLRNPPSRFAKTTEESDYIMYTLEASQLNQAIRELKLVAPEAVIQPNYKYQKAVWTEDPVNGRSIPADYNNSIHWNLEQINAPEVWYYLFNNTTPASHTGSADVTVAVLDTGVAYETYTLDSLEDAFDRSYRVISDLQSTTFVNGYDPSWEFMCDIWAGQGFPCNATELEKINHANDDDGHGTFVTSIIASQIADESPNNILGIAPSVQIMPIKIFLPKIDWMGDDKGATYDSIIINGLDHAITNNADVINMSFGGYNEGDALFEAKIDEARNAGIVLVGASGNENGPVFFPASLDNVIAVGASNYAGTDKANYSNYGPELDVVSPVGSTNGETGVIAATFSCFNDLNGPGEYDDGCGQDDDLTTAFMPNGTYMMGYGTSFAAPQVSAQAALIMSMYPELSLQEIYNRILYNTTNLSDSGFDKESSTGWGIIDIKKSFLNDTLITPTPAPREPITAQFMGQYSYWEWQRISDLVSGDFNNDGFTDLAAFYNMDNGKINLWMFRNNGDNSFTAVFQGQYSYWEWQRMSNISAGDFNNDGFADLAAFYNMDNGKVNLWMFRNNGNNSFTAVFQGQYSYWDWSRISNITGGDFNNDGFADLAAFYNMDNGQINLWVFNNNGNSTFSAQFMGQYTYWEWQRISNITSGDFNNDGFTDIAAFYNMDNGRINLWNFINNGTGGFNYIYAGSSTYWEWSRMSDLTVGDFNNDNYEDIGMFYNMGDGKINFWIFENNMDTTFTADYVNQFSVWNWSSMSNFSAGDFNSDGYFDLATMYNYGGGSIGIWAFQ